MDNLSPPFTFYQVEVGAGEMGPIQCKSCGMCHSADEHGNILKEEDCPRFEPFQMMVEKFPDDKATQMIESKDVHPSEWLFPATWSSKNMVRLCERLLPATWADVHLCS